MAGPQSLTAAILARRRRLEKLLPGLLASVNVSVAPAWATPLLSTSTPDSSFSFPPTTTTAGASTTGTVVGPVMAPALVDGLRGEAATVLGGWTYRTMFRAGQASTAAVAVPVLSVAAEKRSPPVMLPSAPRAGPGPSGRRRMTTLCSHRR